MNELIERKPHRVALSWRQAQGYYVLAVDGMSRAFTDPDEADNAIRAAIDPRIDVKPRGYC